MNLLVLGANSDIAFALASVFAKNDHAAIWLASRDMEQLERKASDLRVRYEVETQTVFFDALDFESHKAFYEHLHPKPDGVVIAFGYLGDQNLAQADFEEANRVIWTNYTGCVSISEIIAQDFETRGHGFIIGISSVAGERGRQSNYIYGSAKAGFSTYLAGLRNRLFKKNIGVITVLPGFIRTKMTVDLELPDLLTDSPENAANRIYDAYVNGRDTVYCKWIWKWIMLIIRMIPEKIFKRMCL